MIGSTNAGSAGNGGSVQAYAFINVSYPVGSVCTCTKGTTVLQASNTNGSYAFSVSGPGSWVVSCTSGTQTAESTVVVLSEIVYNVTLSYHVGADYQEVEYLQGYNSTVSVSSKHGYINSLNYYPNLDTDDIIIDAYYDSSCYGAIFGRHNGNATWAVGVYSPTDFSSGNNIQFYYPPYNSWPVPQPVDGLLEYRCADHLWYKEGTAVSYYVSTDQTNFEGKNVYLMTYDMADYNDYILRGRLRNGKVRSFVVRRNGVEIHHLYPCYRKSDSRPGFYDNITGIFHTSPIADDPGFILGPDVT